RVPLTVIPASDDPSVAPDTLKDPTAPPVAAETSSGPTGTALAAPLRRVHQCLPVPAPPAPGPPLLPTAGSSCANAAELMVHRQVHDGGFTSNEAPAAAPRPRLDVSQVAHEFGGHARALGVSVMRNSLRVDRWLEGRRSIVLAAAS